MSEKLSYQSDSRKRSRVKIALEVHISGPQAITARVQSDDISLKGLSCSPNPGLKVGDICEVLICLSKDIRISVQGKVVRSLTSSLALDFIKMNEQSFHHLYNLVKLNSEDPDSIATELRLPAFVSSDNSYEYRKKK